jgi:hypothetical protein
MPKPLVKLLQVSRLRTWFMAKAEAQEGKLLGSGYLTNASISMTNLTSIASDEKSYLAELQRRLQSRHIEYITYSVESNNAMVTCRSTDLATIRAAIAGP